jgi:hypothetical protein
MNQVTQKQSTAKRSMNSGARWYVLLVRSGFEAIAAQKLRQTGFEAYLPKHNLSSRTGLPRLLFPGYVFCRFALKQRRSVCLVTGALYVLGVRKRIAFDDGEIASSRIATNSGLKIEVLGSLRRRNRIRVLRGPLSGLEGFILTRTGKRYFAMSVRPLKQVLAFKFEKWPIQFIPTNPSCDQRATL